MAMVTMSEEECEALVSDRERLQEQVDSLSELTLHDTRSPSHRISRPAWIAFVNMVSLLETDENLDFTGAYHVALSPPRSLRLSGEEIDILNSWVNRTFATAQLEVQVTEINCRADARHTELPCLEELDRYTPERHLNVVVVIESAFRSAAPDLPLLEVEANWALSSGEECLQVGMWSRYPSLDRPTPQPQTRPRGPVDEDRFRDRFIGHTSHAIVPTAHQSGRLANNSMIRWAGGCY